MTSENNDHEVEYSHELIDFLETLWGEGYLSPGGADEVRAVLEGMDLTGQKVLDLGCGSGGIAIALAAEHGAGRVVGVDVEGPVLARARERAKARGLNDRIEFVQVTPGPLPFDEGEFDVVFSKDAMVHISDKEALFSDLYRVLKPGGWLAASDWLIAHDDELSPEMAHYIEQEGASSSFHLFMPSVLPL